MGIKESFINLAQATAEDRAEVNNLTDVNRHLATQVAKQANNMATKDATMKTMTKLIQPLQGEI